MMSTASMQNMSPNTLDMTWFSRCNRSVIPLLIDRNTGAEAVETAIKLARRWGYMKKGIPDEQAIVLSAEGNFHGRTTGVVSMSTDPESRDLHGPYLPLVGATVPSTGRRIHYNNIADLEEALERHGKNVAAFLVEPIQGEAGYSHNIA